MRVHHATLHQQFTNSFPSDVIRAWESEVTKWEADPTRSNPFDDTNPRKSPISIGRQKLTIMFAYR